MKKIFVTILITATLATGCAGKDDTSVVVPDPGQAQTESTTAEVPSDDGATETAGVYDEAPVLAAALGYEKESMTTEGGAVSTVYRSKDDNTKVVVISSGAQGDVNTAGREGSFDTVINDTVVTLQQVETEAQYSAWWTAGEDKYLVDTFNLEYEDFDAVLKELLP